MSSQSSNGTRIGAAALAGLASLVVVVGPALALDLPPTREGVYVYDLAHVWRQSTVDRANATITAIRDRTQAQIAVVSWPTGFSSVDTSTARADAIVIMDTWGVGRQGVNDGLVILFDMDETLVHGQIYLYTGSGFRDLYLSDSEAADVVDGTMLPRAKDDDLNAALLDGLAKVDHVVQPAGNPDRAGQALLHLLLGLLIVGVALVVLAFFLRTWWLRGRDARMPTIDDSVLLPAPPPDLTPALATVLRKDGVDQEAFTSAMVDLGHRGLVTFQEDGGLLGLSHHLNLVVPGDQLSDSASEHARRRPLGDPEAGLFLSIAAKALNGVLGWKELKAGEGKKLFDAFRPAIGRAAKASGWFRDDPTKLTSRWASVGVALGFLSVLAAFFLMLDTSESSSALIRPSREYLGWPLLIAFVVGIVIVIFGSRLAARTVSGAETLAMALAYRNTLRFEMAQSRTIDQAVQRTTSRLPWITTPDELTVWAVALGLKHEIDKLIKETFAEQRAGAGAWTPLWFTGSGGFGSVGNVTSMLSSISATSASSSGSGYGGGSSGGGGGSGGGF
jgi:uncharacterized membrane protein YgcG